MTAAAMDQVIRIIHNNRSFVVTTHTSPEGDALGSSVALALLLRQLGKEARVVIKDPIPYFLEFLPGKELIEQSREIGSGIDVICVCDCGDVARTGYFRNPAPGERIPFPSREVVNIDHHVSNKGFGTVNWIDPRASATGEMIFDLIQALKGTLTPSIATAIYTTIITETGSFHYSNTNEKMFRIAAECVSKGIDVNQIAKGIFDTSSKERLILLGKVLETLEVQPGGKIASVTVSGRHFRDTGTTAEDTENFVNYPRSIKGVEVAVLFRELSEKEYKISLRSQKELDVAEIAEMFGGGGHRKAAGCAIQGTLEEVKKEVFKRIAERMTGG